MSHSPQHLAHLFLTDQCTRCRYLGTIWRCFFFCVASSLPLQRADRRPRCRWGFSNILERQQAFIVTIGIHHHRYYCNAISIIINVNFIFVLVICRHHRTCNQTSIPIRTNIVFVPTNYCHQHYYNGIAISSTSNRLRTHYLPLRGCHTSSSLVLLWFGCHKFFK